MKTEYEVKMLMYKLENEKTELTQDYLNMVNNMVPASDLVVQFNKICEADAKCKMLYEILEIN